MRNDLDCQALMTAQTRRIAALFRPYRVRLGAVLGLIALSASLAMVSPFLLREVLDAASPTATPRCSPGSSGG